MDDKISAKNCSLRSLLKVLLSFSEREVTGSCVKVGMTMTFSATPPKIRRCTICFSCAFNGFGPTISPACAGVASVLRPLTRSCDPAASGDPRKGPSPRRRRAGEGQEVRVMGARWRAGGACLGGALKPIWRVGVRGWRARVRAVSPLPRGQYLPFDTAIDVNGRQGCWAGPAACTVPSMCILKLCSR